MIITPQQPDEGPAPQTALGGAGSPGRPHVLLIEDDNDFRALLAGVLRDEGYRVTESPDGLHCLEFCVHTTTDRPPGICDVIVSDVRMPGMSGFDLLDGLRHAGRHPAVILMTAFADPATYDKARRLGAAAVLDKPFSPRELCHEIARVLAMPEHEREYFTAGCGLSPQEHNPC